MRNNKFTIKQQYSAKKDRTIGSVLFRILGEMIILAVILLCIPVAIPRLMGYQVYNIVSGSMEPTIPVGSAIYVKEVKEPQEIPNGEIAVFEVEGFVVAHRVVLNDVSNKELHTKGDANAAEDMRAVAYHQILGTVSFHIGFLGNMMFFFTSTQGKLYILGFLMGGILCIGISHLLTTAPKEDERVEEKQAFDGATAHKKLRYLTIFAIIIAVSLVIVLGILVKIFAQYGRERKEYAKVAETVISHTASKKLPSEVKKLPTQCPIEVDFAALKQVNPEIIGWIYCENTVINYPICYSGDDEYYLTHSYDKSVKKSGAIFLEALNDIHFEDSNSILYGHHMKDKSMFATLSYWAKQEYYEAHPYMWLITPQQIYRLDIISGYDTVANSDSYTIFQENGDLQRDYIEKIIKKSQFQADIDTLLGDGEYEDEKYVMLSTCEYTSEHARYVLHGVLRKMTEKS